MLQADRERLGHRRHVVRQVAGNLDQRVLVEQHEFAAAARAVVAEADHRIAPGNVHHRRGGHPPARAHRPPAAGSVIDHLADIFVARHERPREIERGIGAAMSPREIDDVLAGVQEMLVRRAEPAAVGAYQRLAHAGHRIGHLADMDDAVLYISGLHAPSSSCPADRRTA